MEHLFFRVIPESVYTLDELEAPDIFKELELMHKHYGLIVVAGPTGSSKSRTLAALIDHINKTEQGHIISIEDPIECTHKS